MKTLTKLSAFLVGTLMLLAAFSPAVALSSLITAPGMCVESVNGSSYYSSNWSGYAVTGSAGSVTSASGSWTVPAVTGSRFTTAYAAFWVGIDGFASNTVEQTGTLSEIANGRATYYAWYEFYPNPMYTVTSVPITPGDVISASVTYSAGSFTVSIKDNTKSTSWTSAPTTVSGATESSAEWIAEAPSSSRGVLPLANFGTVNFGYDTTNIKATCWATVGVTSGPISLFGSAIQSITMATESYNFRTHSYTINPEATPSPLSSDGTSFSITEP